MSMSLRAASGALGVAALAGVTAALLAGSLRWPLVHDAPIMHYLAWRIAEGAAPYRDLFDMNVPGVYLLHLGVLRALGPGDAAWRAFDLAWLALGAGAVAALAAPWGALAASGGALLFAAHHLAGGAWHAGQRDFLLAPFLLLAALGVARWMEGRGGAAALAGGGLALGAGATLKPHAAALGVALGLLILAAARRQRRPGLAALASFGAGAVAVPAAVAAWVVARGGGPAWREIVLEYLLPLYARLGPDGWGFHRGTVWLPIGIAVALSLGLAAAGRGLTARRGVAAVGLAYGVLHYVGQGKGWEYHVYPLAAFAAPLACSGLDPSLRRGVRAGAALLAASLAVAAVMLHAKGVEAADAAWIADKHRRAGAVVAALAPRLRRGDLVQVLDTTEGGALALLRLRAVQPTRFVYDFHFHHDVESAYVQRLRAEFLAALDRRPPRFVVLFERGWPGGGYERVARFPGLAGRLASRYIVAVEGDGFRIHAKRDDP
jgi:hypothetical protein